MNILYLSQRFGFTTSGIFADLVRELSQAGHTVTVVTCYPASFAGKGSSVAMENGVKILYVQASHLFSHNRMYKGIAQVLLPQIMIKGISAHLDGSRFDLILYPTPPITFSGVVNFCKKKYGAQSFLMLKDIFPQNAVDLGIMKEGGFIHRYFKHVERKLYKVSDYIGCMTNANVDYFKNNNANIPGSRVILFPNSLDCRNLKRPVFSVNRVRTTFVFGGNLGLPQDVPLMLSYIKALPAEVPAEFIIIGDGFYRRSVEDFILNNPELPVTYIREVPRSQFDDFLDKCDVGLVFLSSKFTVPNFPARILSYMSRGLPILAMTDDSTDVDGLIELDAICGYWGSSDSGDDFSKLVTKFCESVSLHKFGQNGQDFLVNNFDVSDSVKILEHIIEPEVHLKESILSSKLDTAT